MILDTSVLAAIAFREPERLAFLEKMSEAPRLLLSAASFVEIGAVLLRRGPASVEREFEGFIERAGIVIVPVDEAQALVAREAYRRFGRGLGHRAGLNFGDCFSYALAIQTNDALLFKGDDFVWTDVLKA